MAGRDRLAHKLPDDANEALFRAAIAPAMLGGLVGQENPVAFFVGGQPGAGKTALQEAIAANSDLDFGLVAKVNGDDYRAYHPDYDALNDEDDTLAAYYTDADAGVWVTKSIELVKRARSHILVEGTLRRPEVTVASARDLAEAGYACELHVVVANGFFSRLRIFSRYLGQKERDGYGRYTLLEAHDASYDALPGSLDAILARGVFSRVVLYDIERSALFDSARYDGDAAAAVRAIVLYTRGKLHQPLDKILADVQSLRALAVGLGCNDLVMGDLAKLERDVIDAAARSVAL